MNATTIQQAADNKKGAKPINTAMPGYKYTPLGWIPEDCEVKELGRLVEEKRPISYGIVQTGESVNGGVKCIRVIDLKEGKIDSRNLITTSIEISNSYKRTILKKGDLVIALRGKIGEVASVEEELVGANLTRGVALIAIKNGVDKKFLHQQIGSEHSKNILKKSMNGSALQEISIGALRKIPVVLPNSEKEQAAIANLLITWDKAITTTAALIALKEQRKRWLMQQLLTGRKRLKGFSGNWKEVKLASFTKKIKGKVCEVSNDHTGVPCITASSFNSVYTDFTNSMDAVHCNETDVLVLWDGENAGAVTTNHSGVIGSTVAKLVLKKGLNNFYITYKLQFENRKLRAIREGSGIPHMPGDFEDWYRFKIPSNDEQTAIVKILSAFDDELLIIKQQLKNLKKQKEGLMQLLLTGKKRMK